MTEYLSLCYTLVLLSFSIDMHHTGNKQKIRCNIEQENCVQAQVKLVVVFFSILLVAPHLHFKVAFKLASSSVLKQHTLFRTGMTLICMFGTGKFTEQHLLLQ